jgi:hypothetical protein
MSEIYDILELCLQDIEKGANLDSVLARYPEHAAELRPLLETAVKAIQVPIPDPASEIIHRNRARVLQHAAELREAKAQTKSRRLWSVPLRRALVTLVVIGVLFMSSTGLVRAASTTLPGDQLYPVKRTWEDVLVTFTFNMQSRNALEVEHENERLSELNELFVKGRSVSVDFSGLVTRQNGDLWLVSGIPVAVSAQTDFSNQTIVIGNAVHVIGTTQKDGAVLAEKIELLPSGVPLPEVSDDDSSEIEHQNSGPSSSSGEDNSGRGSEDGSPNVNTIQTPSPESESESGSNSSSTSEPRDQSFNGVVQSINGNILVVNGQIVNVSTAQEINGTPRVGASVKVEGYYDANGLFIVTKIEFSSGGSDVESTSGSNDNHNDSGGHDDGSDSSGGSDDHGGDTSGSSGGDDSGSSGGGGGD